MWQYVIPAISAIVVAALTSGGLWALVAKRADKNDAERKMLVGLAHDRIIHLGMVYIERGYVTQDEYENLNDYLYAPYEKMGGNGSAKRVIEEVRRLPIRRGNRHSTRKAHGEKAKVEEADKVHDPCSCQFDVVLHRRNRGGVLRQDGAGHADGGVVQRMDS